MLKPKTSIQMKNILLALGSMLALSACSDENGDLACRNCDSCTGLAQAYNGQEFCPDGFDNDDDFLNFFVVIAADGCVCAEN